MPAQKSFFRKLHNRFFHRMLGRLFYQSTGDFYRNPSPRKRLTAAFNQFLNESGAQTPLIYTKKECGDFWSSIDNHSSSSRNRPESYENKSSAIARYLHEFWSPEVGMEDSILELGCNCGVNLNHLQEMGYRSLSGIEINPAAVAQMRSAFPKLRANVILGSLEERLRELPSASYDVVFTMGVSMHIHPRSNFLFAEMKRVAKKYVCTIEPEPANSNYVFARNYGRVFEKLGCIQVKSVLLNDREHSHVVGYQGCTLRLIRAAAGAHAPVNPHR